MAAMSPGGRYGEVEYLRPGIDERDMYRVLRGAFAEVTREMEAMKNDVTGLHSSLGIRSTRNGGGGTSVVESGVAWVKQGIAGEGLQAGHLCYQSGETWFPAVNTDEDKFARGVCLSVNGGNCTILRAACPCMVRCKEQTIAPGTTLWVSSTPGVAEAARPEAGVVAFYQEIGNTSAPVRNNQVEIMFLPRIEPER